ncbi:MAG: universal stress protein [Flavobacteriales bacterium]
MARILIPTDFSENAMHAAEYAVRLFGPTGNTYHFLHIFMDYNISAPLVPAAWSPELLLASEDDMRDFTADFTERTGATGVEHEVMIGALASTIHAIAVEKGADVVVMGKRGGTGSMFFGSNTTDVLKQVRVPVLAVPESAHTRDVGRILLADDYEDVSLSDLAPLRTIALLKKAEVIVTHVEQEPQDRPDHWSHGLYDLALKDVPHSFTESHGRDVVDGLEHTAHQRKADMIAVLHRHLPLMESMFHTSLAKRMALAADLPLLVLHHQD